MKKNPLLCWVLCAALLLGAAVPVRGEEAPSSAPTEETTGPTLPPPEQGPIPETAYGTDASITNGCHTLGGQKPLRSDAILETGRAGLLYEVNSDTLVYAWNPDEKVYPAGMVKLMTGLLTLESLDLNREVTVTRAALDRVPGDSVRIGLEAGEVLTVEQLLYCMLVFSANDAAVVLSEEIAGTQEAFVVRMNQKARDLGCTNTHYVNVHGIHDEQQYTTARDLARLMRYALDHFAVFKTILSADSYEIPETEKTRHHAFNTSNYMISANMSQGYFDSRVTCGRTSSNQEEKRSVIVTAEEGNFYYIGVVMDTEPVYDEDSGRIKTFQEFVEMKALLDLGFHGYAVRQVLSPGQIVGRLEVTNGENSVAVSPVASVAAVLPEDMTFDQLTLHYQKGQTSLTAPVAEGQQVDVLQLWYGAVCIAQTELVALNPSRAAPVPTVSQETPPAGVDPQDFSQALVVFGVILGVILGIAAVLYLIRWVRSAALRAKRRRRRSSRRRSR